MTVKTWRSAHDVFAEYERAAEQRWVDDALAEASAARQQRGKPALSVTEQDRLVLVSTLPSPAVSHRYVLEPRPAGQKRQRDECRLCGSPVMEDDAGVCGACWEETRFDRDLDASRRPQ